MIERVGLTKRWSDAVANKSIIFLAGHTPDKSRGECVTQQTEEVLKAIDDTLANIGVSKDNLAMVQIYLADISTIGEMNVVWDRWVATAAAPARATVEARLAHPDLAIEITAVAFR